MKHYNYRVILKNSISALDQKTLTYLYLPIIGPRAMALYQFLAYEYELLKELKNMHITEERILSNLGYSIEAFERQCKRLEAMNLLEILQNDKRNNKIYNIYAPLEPNDFFNNQIFSGMLLKIIGKDNFDIAKFSFKDEGDILEVQGYTKRVISIHEVFENVEEIPDLIPKGIKSKPRKTNPLLKEFKTKEIIDQLAQHNIFVKEKDKIMKLIENIYSLYKVPIEDILKAVVKIYDYDILKLDEEKMYAHLSLELNREECTQTALTFDVNENIVQKQKQKIYEFEKINSEDYFLLLTNASSLLTEQKEFINNMRNRHKMRDAVINCLLDFSFLKNKGRIIYNYLYKIAATLRELNIKTPNEAMVYLKEAAQNSNKSTFKLRTNLSLQNKEVEQNLWNDPQDVNGYKASDVVDEELFKELWGQA